MAPHCCSNKDFLLTLSELAPSLTRITFITSTEAEDFPAATTVESLDACWPQFFSRLENLVSLFLPINFATPALLSAASTSGKLEQLMFITLTDPTAIVRKRRDLTHFPRPSIGPGSFPVLHQFELAAPFDAVSDLICDSNFPAHQLAILGLRAVRAEPERVVHSLLSDIAKRACPVVLRIQLAANATFGVPPDLPPDVEDFDDRLSQNRPHAVWINGDVWLNGLRERLRAATLTPLQGSSTLSVLDIAHRHSVHIYDDELVDLVKALPALVVLSLNPAPICIGVSTLSLAVLSELARVRPSLRMVRLYINATLDEEEVASSAYQFAPTMRSLWLNASPIAEAEDNQRRIASYLQSLLPHSINLDTSELRGLDGGRMYFWDHVPPVKARFAQAWQEVAKLVEELRVQRAIDNEDRA